MQKQIGNIIEVKYYSRKLKKKKDMNIWGWTANENWELKIVFYNQIVNNIINHF
jgi:hypothetical protein